MEKFITLTSPATPFLFDDIDTDVIYPGQYLKVVTRTGLEVHGFEAIRFNHDGSPKADAIFNQPPFDEAAILLTGENFGCGSSREHAVWTIMSMGYRAIIAKGYGDIFRSNCYKNGLLPIELPAADVDWIADNVGTSDLVIDLSAGKVTAKGKSFTFDISPQNKHCLLNGLDQISLTLEEANKIKAFEATQRKAMPWLYGQDEQDGQGG